MLIYLGAWTMVVFDDRMSITPRFQFGYQQREEGGLA
jgi:hypothetical protein